MILRIDIVFYYCSITVYVFKYQIQVEFENNNNHYTGGIKLIGFSFITKNICFSMPMAVYKSNMVHRLYRYTSK